MNVGFIDRGTSKSTVAVAHERLTDVEQAQTTKANWKDRLTELKSFLES
ncbi:hypothetical protein BH20ACT21_BH20ACT21_09680 [soil metagenome]